MIRKLRSRLALRAVEPAAQQERCEQVIIRSWSADLCRVGPAYFTRRPFGRDCDGRGQLKRGHQ